MTLIHAFLERIQPNPFQTRLGEPDPEYIQELALDINANTLLQPAMGRLVDSTGLPLDWATDDEMLALCDNTNVFVQLAFGHNRKAAYAWLCQNGPLSSLKITYAVGANYSKLPVDLRPLTDEQMADYAWSENERRLAVNPYERYMAVQRRMDVFNWTQEQAAEHLRLSRSTVSNILRIGKLPEGVKADLRLGHIAERTALALLPLYDLPQEILDIAERNWSDVTKPSQIIASARIGQSSEMIRERVEKIITAFGTNLQLAEWKLDEKVEHNDVHALTCRGCHLRLKERNLCLDKDCFDLKKAVWRQAYLYLAQRAFDAQHDCWIPLAEDDVDHTATELQYETASVVNTIKASGCENLRIIYKEFATVPNDKPASLSDVGYPRAFIVCRRRNGMCTCKNGVEHLRKTGQAFQPATATPQPVANSVENGDAEAQSNKAEPEDLQPETCETVTFSATDLQEVARQARKDKAMYRQIGEQATNGAIKILADHLITGDYYAWVVLAKHLFGFSLKDDEIPTHYADVAQLVAKFVISSITGYWDDREKPAKINTWLVSKYLPEVKPQTLVEVFESEESEE
jgi:ParB-like chromosome segregation protein Spo0J